MFNFKCHKSQVAGRRSCHMSQVTGHRTCDLRLATCDKSCDMRHVTCDAFLYILILLGISLRFIDLSVPDFATDEAQFALFASAAQPPAGMWLFWLSQAVFGQTILATRAVSALLGILTILLIYLSSRTFLNKEASLIIAAIASVFPPHVIFSRLAYLSSPLIFAWALLLFVFLKAQKNPRWLVPLFLSSVFATFVKTQGLLLPLLLIIGILINCIIQSKKTSTALLRYCAKSQLSIISVLFFSLIPITFYILTSPGILATLSLYGGNMYGISGFLERIKTLLLLWWNLTPLFCFLIFLSIFSSLRCMFTFIRKNFSEKQSYCATALLRYFANSQFPLPVFLLILISFSTGLLLGPSHEYYAADLVFFSIPIGIYLAKWPSLWRNAVLLLAASTTFLLASPRNILITPYTHYLFKEEGYWNTHAEKINEVLKNEDRIIVLGSPGHHIRWYLNPEVLVGKDMDIYNRTGTFLLLDKNETAKFTGAETMYEDEKLTIIKSQNTNLKSQKILKSKS